MDKHKLSTENLKRLIWPESDEWILAGRFDEKKSILKTKIYEIIKLNNLDFQSKGFYVGIPIISIFFTEILIYFEMVKSALWIHTAILMCLLFSIKQIKNREARKTYQALMLLPLLRLVTISIPVIFKTTLYSIFVVYIPLAVLAIIAVSKQQLTREEIGMNFGKMWLYFPLSILISFGLSVGDYKVIQTDYLIPDLSSPNLLKLILIMVFVGFVEELIFRSVLQTRLNNIFGAWGGILLSSILFGFMHSGYGTFYEILYISFAGIVIGYMFYKTQSLPLVTLVHGFGNVFLFGFIPHLGLGLGLL